MAWHFDRNYEQVEGVGGRGIGGIGGKPEKAPPNVLSPLRTKKRGWLSESTVRFYSLVRLRLKSLESQAESQTKQPLSCKQQTIALSTVHDVSNINDHEDINVVVLLLVATANPPPYMFLSLECRHGGG